jgi:phage-related protein
MVIGFEGVGGALGAMNEEMAAATAEGRAFNIQAEDIAAAMKNLTPNARDFASAFAELLPVMRSIRGEVQERLFAGLDDTLRRLSGTLLPQVGDALVEVAGSLNTFFRDLGATLADVEFADLFTDIKPAIDDVLGGVNSLVKAIEPFFRAATPAARQLAESFRNAADGLRRMIEAGERSGELEAFLSGGVDSLRRWGDLAGEVTGAMTTLFQAGKADGDAMVTSLAGIVDKFDDWMESVQGQRALEEFFTTSKDLMSSLTPLLEGLVGFFDNLVTPGAIDRFERLADSIGRALPFLGQLFEIVGRTELLNTMAEAIALVGEALQPVMPAIQGLADAIGTGLQGALAAIAPQLPGIAEAIGALAEALSPAVATTIGLIGEGFGILAAAIGPVVGLIAEIPTPLLTVVTMFLSFKAILGPMASGLASVVGSLRGMTLGLLGMGPAGAVMAGLGLVVAGISTIFIHNQQKAQKAKEEVLEYVSALEGMADGASSAEAVSVVLNNLLDESKEVREGFRELGFSAGEWAREVVEGASTAEEGIADLIDAAGTGGARIAEGLRNGTIELDTFLTMLGRGNTTMGDGLAFGPMLEDLYKVGLNSRTAADAFGFLRDESKELGLAADEVALRAAEAGTGLEGMGTSSETAAADQAALSAAMDTLNSAASGVGASTQEASAGVENMSNAVIDSIDAVTEGATAMDQAAEAATRASEAADTMRTAFDLLISPALSLQESVDAQRASFDELAIALVNGTAGVDGATLSLDENTEAGRLNREQIRENVQGILDYGVASTDAGVAAGITAQRMSEMRAELVQQVMGFGLSEEAANAYVDQLGLTPETIDTTVVQPGMDAAVAKTSEYDTLLQGVTGEVTTDVALPTLPKAMGSAQDYDLQLEHTTPLVETDFETPGLDTSMEAASAYNLELEATVPGVTTNWFTPGLDRSMSDAEEYNAEIEGTEERITSTWFTPGLGRSMDDASEYNLELGDIPSSVSTTVNANTGTASSNLSGIRNQVDALDGRTIRLAMQVSRVPLYAEGGTVGAMGGIGGEAGPELIQWGGRAAIINQPTPLAPGTQVTPLKGDGMGTAIPAGKVVNNYMTFQTQSDDPEAIAQQMLNRTAAFAVRS